VMAALKLGVSKGRSRICGRPKLAAKKLGRLEAPGPTSLVPATGGWTVQAREREV
jgi:hypothetical protein